MGECKNLTQIQTIILASNDGSLNQGKFQRKLTVKWEAMVMVFFKRFGEEGEKHDNTHLSYMWVLFGKTRNQQRSIRHTSLR